MFIRGSGSGFEYRREDFSFYKGVVVKNDDPLALNRVKIYIPDISNQPFDDWFEEFDNIDVRHPGKNNENDKWIDTKIFEDIVKNIPWAEPCYPLMGESGNARYYKDGEIHTMSDCNYPEGFEIINESPPSLSAGSFSPAFLYENKGTRLGDGFNSPLNNYSIKCNPYSFNYNPSSNSNKPKGMFGIPEVGSKVWVFHNTGDLNYPIYFGVYRDYRELNLINGTDNTTKFSEKYPMDFEGSHIK